MNQQNTARTRLALTIGDLIIQLAERDAQIEAMVARESESKQDVGPVKKQNPET